MVRYILALAALLALLAGPAPAWARSSTVTILLGAHVTRNAQASMPPDLWRSLMGSFFGGTILPFDGTPTLADCRTAGAAFFADATFDLLPRLAATAENHDRLPAQAHMVAVNCQSGQSVLDTTVLLASNPLSTSNVGDYEPSAEVTWERSVRETLARTPFTFPHVARVVQLDGPYIYVDLEDRKGLVDGQILTVYADKFNKPRTPVHLMVTERFGNWVQTVYDPMQKKGHADLGDYVEAVGSH